jgi:hypothetical protein
MEQADATGAWLCTLWECVGESLTALRRHFGWRAARALAAGLRDLVLVPCDASHRLQAVSDFVRVSRGRRPPSFVDVLCAVVIRSELAGDPALSLGLTVIS